MKRIQMLDMQAKPSATTPTVNSSAMSKQKPTIDVWESMGLDGKMSEKAVALRKATGAMMDEVDDKLVPHLEAASFPFWIIEKFKALKINGLAIKGHGSPGLN